MFSKILNEFSREPGKTAGFLKKCFDRLQNIKNIFEFGDDGGAQGASQYIKKNLKTFLWADPSLLILGRGGLPS